MFRATSRPSWPALALHPADNQLLIYTIVFGNIARLPTDGLPDAFLPVWHSIVALLFELPDGTSQTFIQNAHIFGKVYFPRLVMPISIVISNLITLAIQFTLFISFWVFFFARGAEIHITSWALAFPLLVFLMAGLGLGLGIFISSLTTKYRDLKLPGGLWRFAVDVYHPIIYPVSSIPQKWQWVANINPITPIIETFRMGFLGQGDASWQRLAYSFGCTLLLLFIGAVIFNRVEKTFIDTV